MNFCVTIEDSHVYVNYSQSSSNIALHHGLSMSSEREAYIGSYSWGSVFIGA